MTDANKTPVMWADLQSELSAAGLNVSVGIPMPSSPWPGQIDDKPFFMSLPSKDEDGLRGRMIISLYGQDESVIIPQLNKFMGYPAFCKYLDRRNPTATATYEWAKDAAKHDKENANDENCYDIERFAEGFATPIPPIVETFFQQFTPEVLAQWEQTVTEMPEAQWSENRIADLLPFIRKVMPRIGQNQSLFGLSIISVEGPNQNIEAIVRYGLEPIITAGLIGLDDTERIVKWFVETKPTWDSSGTRITVNLNVDGHAYILTTDCYRNCRDLNLRAV